MSILVQNYDGSEGGFPYNIPRHSSTSTNLTKSHDVKQIFPEDDKLKLYTVPSSLESSKIENSKPFYFKPETKTGRVLYEGFNFETSGYGFGKEVPIDITSINRDEIGLIRRRLKDWLKTSNYQMNCVETHKVTPSIQATSVGFLLGFCLNSLLIPTVTSRVSVPLMKTKYGAVASSVVAGVVSSYLMRLYMSKGVFMEVLTLNTPLGYKARQILSDYRQKQSANP